MQMHKYNNTSCWLLLLSCCSLPEPYTLPHRLGTALAARASGFFLPDIQNAEFLEEQERHRSS